MGTPDGFGAAGVREVHAGAEGGPKEIRRIPSGPPSASVMPRPAGPLPG
ncbi:hypothetical protein SFR_5659 [Streptomyces sp. FR-008]|nr:hypothetical protein SFR_5659 [Streptomyces sp. FR-008]